MYTNSIFKKTLCFLNFCKYAVLCINTGNTLKYPSSHSVPHYGTSKINKGQKDAADQVYYFKELVLNAMAYKLKVTNTYNHIHITSHTNVNIKRTH